MMRIKSLIFFLTLCYQVSAFASFKIVIDPGHGGIDTGAVKSKVIESELALIIGKKVGALLEKDPDFSVFYTRKDNSYISLEERVALSERKKADAFLSIHLNSSKDSRASGKEIFFQNLLPPDEESLYLANQENKGRQQKVDRLESNSDLQLIIQDLEKNHRVLLSSQLSEALHRNWGAKTTLRQRPIRQAPFLVLAKSSVPSVLVEVGYISNAREAKMLSNSEFQDKIANGMYLGLKEFKELVDKQRPTNLD